MKYIILSHTECKRVHELKKPDPKDYNIYSAEGAIKFREDVWAWEEAERTLNIHPDCLVIKEGDKAWHSLGGGWVDVEGTKETNAPFIRLIRIVETGNRYYVNDAEITKFPLNSIWHGEERGGSIFLTDKI